MIIRNNTELKSRYHELGSGDIFIGTLSSRHLKKSILIDLLERGVTCIPSPQSQNLNNSKVAQALVFKAWMLPHTVPVTRRAELVKTISQYNRHGIAAVVSKEDGLHCGHGIRRWDNIEALFSYMGLRDASYPFVVQPFLENFTDVRVIIVGDWSESYVRYNPNNFRMNLSVGARHKPFDLDEAQKKFCIAVMERGKFPYAHLDLMILDDGKCYLSEIALNGGIKGAMINRKELDQKKKKMIENLASSKVDG